ncbi:MAG: peptidase M16 [Gammaproteobacteria bacterium]|nr:MAG: peptidase M16 [Gammaproteobacteria bacterium]
MEHKAFKLLRTESITSLNIEVQEYEHIKTGAMHYHLACENNENTFLVALRTVPTDCTGVAHILEHTALCGSEKFPVRDPFFMMLRRSLNTYMNALTSSDWTAYPFATQCKKDFNNLLDVYLDAVFFSRLDELDFLQEGWRYEFSQISDPQSKLEYKGVVFNEMKGAMSSPVSVAWQALTKNVFPTSTYHYNSGGDPEVITDLSYQQLKDFYKVHYHPSNAMFFTFGDISAFEHQENIESKVLQHFDRLDRTIEISKEKRYATQQTITEYFSPTDDSGKGQLVLSWLLNESSDIDDLLEAEFLSSVLLENSASPLRNLLETTDLADSPSPLTGVETTNKEMMFMCGIDGADVNKINEFDQQVTLCLQNLIQNGVDQDYLEAILHQLEFSQREIGGDREPFGLQLIFSAISTAVHQGDVISILNLDPAIEKLRSKIQDANYIKELINKLLLQNNHKIRLVMKPDPDYNNKKQQFEEDKLAKVEAELDVAAKQSIVDNAKALLQRQQELGDESILPKVTREDIPELIDYPQGKKTEIANIPAVTFKSSTNGISYCQIITGMPDFSLELYNHLPLFTTLVSELGYGDYDYKQVQHLQTAHTGSIGCYTSLRSDKDDIEKTYGFVSYSGKALNRKFEKFVSMLDGVSSSLRFDEHDRMVDLIAQMRLRKENSITSNGHAYAMQAAASGISPLAGLLDTLGGLDSIKRIKELDDRVKAGNGIEEFAAILSSISTQIYLQSKQILLISDQDSLDANIHILNSAYDFESSGNASNELNLQFASNKQLHNMFVTNTQVNFCAKAYPTVSSQHEDAAALAVLAAFLKNGYLHTAIREQGGAYGGGASHDTSIGAFKFYSYRDPRIEGTLDDFDKSLEWLCSNKHEEKQLEEAVLGVIGSLDKPSSPAGEAKKTFYNELFGITSQMRLDYRKRILNTTIEDLIEVAQKYLVPESSSSVVITNEQNQRKASGLGMEIIEI